MATAEYLLKAAFIVLVTASVIFGVIVPIIRNLKDSQHHRDIRSPVKDRPRPAFPKSVEEDEIEIPTTGKSDGGINKKIVKMALDDTSKTSMLIKNWINEKK
ncbi:hypothetical protein KKA14_13830 [bacterium]|nr:hypothetical protein [bacterium]